MNFNLAQASEILERTPAALDAMLNGLSAAWTDSAGDKENWKPFDIIGHLIEAERTDWIPRARIILSQENGAVFEPFDRLAQFQTSEGRTLAELLAAFAEARAETLETLRSWDLTKDQLDLEGTHPELGKVTLRQLLATWVVHDLTHIRQIAIVMAARYREDVGVWKEYLSILK